MLAILPDLCHGVSNEVIWQSKIPILLLDTLESGSLQAKRTALICILVWCHADNALEALVSRDQLQRVLYARVWLGDAAAYDDELSSAIAGFSEALCRRFEGSGERQDIDAAVAIICGSHNVIAASASRTDHGRILGHALITTLQIRAVAFSEPADLEFLRYLLESPKDGESHNLKIDRVCLEALSAVSNHPGARNSEVLQTCTLALKDVAKHLASDDRRRPRVLALYGDCLIVLAAQRTKESAEESAAEAVSALSTADDIVHGMVPRTTYLLGAALLMQFELSKEATDILDKAAGAHIRAVDSSSQKHHLRKTILRGAAHTLRIRFSVHGELPDMDKVIEFLLLAVELDQKDAALLSELATAYASRCDVSGDPRDISAAVKFRLRAVDCSADPSTRASCLSDYGSALRRQAERVQDRGGIDAAIASQLEAISISECQGRSRARFFSNLGNAYRARYEWFGDIQDLRKAVDAHAHAVASAGDGHSSLPIYLHNQALSLLSLHERTTDKGKLDEAIRVQRTAISLVPEDHPSRSSQLLTLGSCLRALFKVTRQESVLDEAIQVQREALALAPRSTRARSVTNLANSLRARFEISDARHDIDEAVELHEEAMRLLPEADVAQRAIYSFNLANALDALHRRFGGDATLARGVATIEDARAALPSGDPHAAGYAASLGGMLLAQGVRDRDARTIGRAIAAHEESMRVARPHERAQSAMGLAGALEARWRLLHEDGDLDTAIGYMRMAQKAATETTEAMFGANLARLLQMRKTTADREEAMRTFNSLVSLSLAQ